jgi:hypothetical protein
MIYISYEIFNVSKLYDDKVRFGAITLVGIKYMSKGKMAGSQ